jgi:hypothetical protein
MIDDTAAVMFAFWQPTANRVLFGFFRDFNFEVADGLDGRKQKTEWCSFIEHMILLGVVLDKVEQRFGAEPAKHVNFRRAVREMVGGHSCPLPDSKVFDVPVKAAQRAVGQLSYVAVTVAPECRALVNRVLDWIPTHGGEARLGEGATVRAPGWAINALLAAGERAYTAAGAVFAPRAGSLGKHGRRVLWHWHDASGDTEAAAHEYRGCGIVMWVEGTDVAFVCQIRLSPQARLSLNSTVLEQYTSSEALVLSEQIARALGVDIAQVGDNQAEKAMAARGSAHSAGTRAAVQLRWAVRDVMPDETVVVAVHAKRDRIPDADWLTRNDLAAATPGERSQFLGLLARRLQRPLRAQHIRPAPGASARLTFLLRATAVAGTNRAPLPCPPVPVLRAGAWRQAEHGAPAAADGAAAGADGGSEGGGTDATAAEARGSG